MQTLPICIAYKVGKKIKVNEEEIINPKTMVDATGPHISDCPPRPIANENKPATVVNVVMVIGIKRRLAA